MNKNYQKTYKVRLQKNKLSNIFHQLRKAGPSYIAEAGIKAQEYFVDKADLKSGTDKNIKQYFVQNNLSKESLANSISSGSVRTSGLKYLLYIILRPDNEYSIKDLKNLFDAISAEKEVRVKESFDLFFENIQKVLPEDSPFKTSRFNFNYEKGKFYIDDINPGYTVKNDKKVSENLVSNLKKDHRGKPKTKKKLKSNRIFLFSLGVLITAFICYKIIDGHYKRKQIDDNIKIVELSKKTEQIRNDELTALYSLVYDELTTDYLEDNKRNLSDILIAKIITMSEKFKPYLYEVDSKVIKKPLSKERAQLFVSLVRYNLDLDTYNEIFKSANFTSSDFSYMDLSDLNFANELNGLYGNYKNEVKGLITISERANLSNSYFYKTNLDKTTIVGILNGCKFEEVNFQETNFNWAELKGSVFENNTLDHVLFNNSNLEGSNFRNSINIGENKGFVNCNLRGVNFDNSTFSGAGYEPFIFKSCFLSTKNIFFKYDFHASKSTIGIMGNPFIEESPLWSKDFYYAYRNIDFNSNEKVSLKVIDSTFKFIGNKKQEETFLKTINSDSSYSKFNYYKVRINDNDNRSSKSFEHLISFDTIRFGIEDLKGDTLQVISSLNKIEYRYRNYSTYLNPVATTEEKTSFKNCSFNFTTFKDSTMEFVDFSGAVFKNPKNTIKNNFINCSFYLNDFRIKDGLFFIDKLSSLDSVIVNLKFPPLVFKEQISKINTQNYRNYKISKSKDSMHIDTFYDQVDMKIKWAEYVNRKMVLDTFDFNNQEAMLLRKTF